MKDVMKKLSKDDDSKDDHYHAKMNVLNELRDMAMNMMGDKVKGKLPEHMKEVSVAAPDQSGLKKGLDLAQHMLPDSEESGEEAAEEKVSPGIHQKIESMLSPNPHHDQSRNSPYSKDMVPSDNHGTTESDFNDDMSDDELDAMINELEAQKASRRNKV